MDVRVRTRISLFLTIVTATAVAWIVLGQQSTTTAAQSNFVGDPPSRPDSSDIRALRLRFEPGARSNWHSHGNWQVIAAEAGRGRTQVRGQAIQELTPGTAVYAGPGLVHWHGAAPDEHVVQLTFVSGETSWLGPVSDDEYLGR